MEERKLEDRFDKLRIWGYQIRSPGSPAPQAQTRHGNPVLQASEQKVAALAIHKESGEILRFSSLKCIGMSWSRGMEVTHCSMLKCSEQLDPRG